MHIEQQELFPGHEETQVRIYLIDWANDLRRRRDLQWRHIVRFDMAAMPYCTDSPKINRTRWFLKTYVLATRYTKLMEKLQHDHP